MDALAAPGSRTGFSMDAWASGSLADLTAVASFILLTTLFETAEVIVGGD